MRRSTRQIPHPTRGIPPRHLRRPRGGSARVRPEGRSEDGQALVEFALVLPIIIVVLLGVVLFGVALNDWINETQLTSEAARFAAVNNEHGTGAEINQASFLKWVKEQGNSSNVKGATATMCSPTSTTESYVEVKLTYNYKWFGLAGLFGVNAETPITSTAKMKIEREPITHYPVCS